MSSQQIKMSFSLISHYLCVLFAHSKWFCNIRHSQKVSEINDLYSRNIIWSNATWRETRKYMNAVLNLRQKSENKKKYKGKIRRE